MQTTSDLYRDILAQEHDTEVKLTIACTEYDKHSIISVHTSGSIFSSSGPAVGCCVSRQIDIMMLNPSIPVPKNAKLEPYVRITDGERFSEWLPKGKFYVDTRENQNAFEDSDTLHIAGFCDMLRTEADYPSSSLPWPAKDIDIVREICRAIGVSLDPRTVAIMDHGYTMSLPAGYSMREVLSGIAVMYGGCWIMNDFGQLRLIRMNELPPVTNLLINERQQYITFGGRRIRIG